MRSGITLDNSVETAAKQIEKDTLGMCFVLNEDNTKVVLEENSFVPKDHSAPFEAITDTFHNDNCRFGLVSIKLQDSDVNSEKIVLLGWAGSGTSIKQKMVYSTCVELVKRELKPQAFVQMGDEEDKNINEVIQSFVKTNKRDVKSFQGRPVSFCKETHTFSYAD